MYSVELGFNDALTRINALISNGHHSESLVTSMFTIEKTLRRTLKQIIISAGFKNTAADKILDGIRGLKAISHAWQIYDPHGRRLSAILGPVDWNIIIAASEKRNKLVHGLRIYDSTECQSETQKVLGVLTNLVSVFRTLYGYDGWTKIAIRKKSVLHLKPKINL